MNHILLRRNEKSFKETIHLASSKSESNRALILNALCNFEGKLENLSTARDTQTLIRLLKSNDETADVLDAGTTMRFLTSYFTIKNKKRILTGTARMCERPIGILVEALKQIGADIEYLQKDGFPPLKVNGLEKQTSDTIEIRGDVSSQFISSILMIAPLLEKGLRVKLIGELGSIPYIKMTLRQMEAFGITVQEDWNTNTLVAKPEKYKPTDYSIESDWSGASYWYSVVALSEFSDAEIELIGLKDNSLQGDSAIAEIMTHLGVKSTFTSKGVLLQKTKAKKTFEWDFTHCPDLAQTIAVIVSVLDISSVFTGLESLKVKETDRVKALQTELAKIGGTLKEVIAAERYELKRNSVLYINGQIPFINTYDDHRMAMAFAPLALKMDIIIEEPGVVAKSYPSFWEDIAKIIKIDKPDF